MAQDLERRAFAGKEVSVLGLGTVKFGRNQGVKYPEGFELPSDKEIEEILELCVESGINLLDTAPAYGTSEERLGKLMGSLRDKFFLVSKAGEEFSNGTSEYIFTPEHIRQSVERSLKRLNTDRLESVLLHCNRDDMNIVKNTGALEELSKLKEEGKILSFGASTYSVEAGKYVVDNADAVMVAYNPEYLDEKEVISYAATKGKAVLIKKGFASGHAGSIEENIRFILETEGVTSLIFGSLKPKNIINNITAALKR